MEGIIPKTKYVSANYSLPDKSNGPHITLVQEFVRERLIAHNPVLRGALNKPAVTQTTKEERHAAADAIISHYKKEEVKSWAKFFFKFLKIFMK